jgi:hypothetical protein
MSTSNHWPTAGDTPGVHREFPLPSIALLGGLPEAETDALAVHPVRGSATGVVLPELLPLPEPPPLLDELTPLEEAETSAEASMPDEPPPEELLLEEPPPPTAPESDPLPDPVPLLPEEDMPVMPDDDVPLDDEPLPLDDEPTPLDPDPFPPPMPLEPLDEVPPPSSAA